jgi:hypothetical protein
VAPPTVNDNYPLVQSYSAVGTAGWDDHDKLNVEPLVDDLAYLMDTDGLASGGGHLGTYVEDMEDGINQYLVGKGLHNDFYVHLEPSPDFEWIEAEIERCQDVVLLLGFWQWHEGSPTHAGGEGYWVRIGGHYVTCAGVNSDKYKLGVSDPYWDSAEAGGDGRVPVSHAYPHDSSVHNDAQYVSHDIYQVVDSDSPGGPWALEDYAVGNDVSNFEGQNWADDLLNYEGEYSPDLPVHTEIDYAVAVSPYAVPTPTPTASPSKTVPTTGGPTPTRTQEPGKPGPTRTDEPTQEPGEPTEEPGKPTEPAATATYTPAPTLPGGKSAATFVTSYYGLGDGYIWVSVHLSSDPTGGWADLVHDVEIYFDGKLVYYEYFADAMPVCQEQVFNVPYEGNPPEEIIVHLTGIAPEHRNLGQIGSSYWPPQQ